MKATPNDAISVTGDVKRASDPIPTTVYHVIIPSECARRFSTFPRVTEGIEIWVSLSTTQFSTSVPGIIIKEVILSPPELSFCTNRALGAIAPCSLDFLTEVGRQLSAATGDALETTFLFQRISVALQRFNAVLIHESFAAPDVEPDL